MSENPSASRGPRVARSGWRRRLKRVLFALTPAVVLLTSVEVGLRIGGLDRPLLFGSPEDQYVGEPLHQPDEELFWSMIPSSDVMFKGVRVQTNELGLRTPPVGRKSEREFRILSLGESTTFGYKVENGETYSALLQQHLNNLDSSREFRVINAGVSAYTSFQSLNYLKQRGLQAQPDLVLLYHEYNDLLPSSRREVGAVREGGPVGDTELGMSDKQCYLSRAHWWHRKLMSCSAIYRFLHFRKVKSDLDRLSESKEGGDVWGLIRESDDSFKMARLPMRVPTDERIEIFNQFHAICQEHNIALVVIHPAYIWTTPHECVLTDFCSSNRVPMFDALSVLQTEGMDPMQLFADRVHPNREGHQRLAQGLATFLVERQLVPVDP